MIISKIYKLYPYVNNSFDETLKVFTDFIMSEFNMTDTIFIATITIDDTKIGSSLSSMEKPKYIYITVNYCTNGSWSNTGGIEYCNFKTDSNLKIYVRWDTSKRKGIFNSNKECEEINNNFFRKIKLKKLNKICQC